MAPTADHNGRVSLPSTLDGPPPDGPDVGVRLARTSDVDDIAAAQVASWRQRFAGILPVAVLDGLHAPDLATVWARAILVPPTRGHRIFVAHEAGVVVGFASIGPADDPDASPNVAELGALDVLPAAQRRGHGSRLLAAVADHARTLECDEIVVWCAVADEARRAFLSSAGWGPDSAYRDLLVGDRPDGSDELLREARLVTVLPSPA